MPKIKRKNKKRIVRKTTQPREFNEDSAAAIPQFLLDKIPAQASLRPSAQSLRAMMMQRFAQPFIQMPTMTPQQQQAQTLKQNNDVKEQALNQAKQDLVVEQARKQEIQQEEAEHKRRHHRMKADLDEQKQILKNQIQDQQEDSKLKFQKMQLLHDQQRHSFQSQTMQAKFDLENMQAVVAQEKAQQQKLQAELSQNKFHQEELRLKDQEAQLKRENEAILNAIAQTNTEQFNNQLLELAANVQKEKAKNVVIHKLKDMNDKVQIDRLEAYARIPENILSQEMENNIEQFSQLQQAMAQQLKTKNDYDEQMNIVLNSRKQVIDTWNRLQNAEFENIALKTHIDSIDTNQLSEKVKAEIQNSVKKEFENKQMNEELRLKEKQNELEENKLRNQAQLQYIQGEDYKQKQLANAAIQQNIQQQQELFEIQREFIENQKQYRQAITKTEVLQQVNEALRTGGDVDEVLNGYRTDTPTNVQEQQIQNEAFAVSTARAQTANQELEFVSDRVKYYQNLFTAEGPDSVRFRRFLEFRKINWEEHLQKADTQTWINLDNDYNKVKDMVSLEDDNNFIG